MERSISEAGLSRIYLAGGCFWGLQKYMDLIPGVMGTQVGYANGKTKDPTYEDVCTSGTGHAETVRVDYDPARVSLSRLLGLYIEAIDPFSRNRQGFDIGPQYRTGIYYETEEDRATAEAVMGELQKGSVKSVMVEVVPLGNYFPAEEYHQKYLEKHPGGYCHIGKDVFRRMEKEAKQG